MDKMKRADTKDSTETIEMTTNGTMAVTEMSGKPAQGDHLQGSASLSVEQGDKEKEERGEWALQIEYLLSVVGYCVSLGNVWRFPYICNRNGGGAFLIPFVSCLVLCGLPLFFLDVTLGQFSGKSAVHVWSVCPLMKGLGMGMVLLSGICPIYFMVISAWALFYSIFSCTAELPWTTCNNTWNTDECVTDIKTLRQDRFKEMNSTVVNNQSDCTILATTSTSYSLSEWNNRSLTSTAAEEFLHHRVLGITGGVHDVGKIRWELALCLLASWIVLFLCLIKGVRSFGKAVYVAATLPYVILTVLLIRGLTLPGGPDGALFYFTPNFRELLNIQVWLEACLQVFYSLGASWGILITLSSYNKFHANSLRNSVVCTFISEGTSMYAGLVVFSILGFMAQDADIPITDVVSSGPGLGFVIYPEALAHLPLPQLWSLLFFVMLILIGMDSMFSLSDTVICAIMDEFPFLLKRRIPVTAAYCVGSFLLGLLLTSEGGMYVFQLIDWYTAAVFPIFAGFAECIIVGWIYGIKRFGADIEMMLGRRPPLFFKLAWCFISPLMLGVTFVFTLSQYQLPTYGNYVYPDYAAAIGWFIAIIPMLPILPMMCLAIYREEGSFLQGSAGLLFRTLPYLLFQRLVKSLSPAASWGPSKQSYREVYKEKRINAVQRGCFTENCLSAVSCKP